MSPARPDRPTALVLLGAAAVVMLGIGLVASLAGGDGRDVGVGAPDVHSGATVRDAPGIRAPGRGTHDGGERDARATPGAVAEAAHASPVDAPRGGSAPSLAGPAPSRAGPSAGATTAFAAGPDAGAGEVDDEDERRGFTRVYTPDVIGIRAAVGEATPLIRECYDAWVRANPTLAGKIVVTFTIADPDDAEADEATVTKVAIRDSTVAHGLLEGCVLNVMGGLRFDRPDDGSLDVSFPFMFSAPSDEAP